MTHHKRFGCKVCKGTMKTKCIFCGFEKPRKIDDEQEYYLYQNWKNYLDFLRTTRQKMINFKMITTGDPGLDQRIRDELGEWRFELAS